jgi:hypothetical protein
MKVRTVLVFISFLGVCTFAQQPAHPQLKLRIVVDKDNYALNERVLVEAELTNLTSTTLCFPVPNQDCESSRTGSVVTTGESVKAGGEQFLCHLDGGGAAGAELEAEIKNRWIKLPPNAVYVTKAAEAKATLSEVGDWRLYASYHPPEPAFNRDYKKVLQSTAENAGCNLPGSSAVAQPKIINVLPPDPKNR